MVLARRFIFLLLWFAAIGGNAQGLVPVPQLTSHVVDSAALLNATQRQALETKLAALESGSGSQVVVLTVSTTQPEDIVSFSNRVGNAWKIGRRGVGDGLLIVVAKDDHKLRIEVAKALEGAIPDLAAKQVIDAAMTPRFKQGDFAGGLDAGVDQIAALIKGEALPTPVASGVGSNAFDWQNLIIFIFLGVFVGGSVIRHVLGNKLGSVVSGGVVGVLIQAVTGSLLIAGLAAIAAMAFVLVSGKGNSFRGRGGGGGSSSGGGWSSGSDSGSSFGSGGGGDFGGGGASGDW